jgi:predicted O-methyltransferase YrrM
MSRIFKNMKRLLLKFVLFVRYGNINDEDKMKSHLRILNIVCQSINSLSVLETGSGENSTLFFLNNVESLVSLETNYDYYKYMQTISNQYDKHTLIFAKDMLTELKNLNLDIYDLIFIDDSINAEDRSKTIEYVCKNANNGIIVIHDVNNRNYRRAVGKRKLQIFKDNYPWTGVIGLPDSVSNKLKKK